MRSSGEPWQVHTLHLGGKVLDLPCLRAYDQEFEEGIEQGIDAFIEDKLEDGILLI